MYKYSIEEKFFSSEVWINGIESLWNKSLHSNVLCVALLYGNRPRKFGTSGLCKSQLDLDRNGGNRSTVRDLWISGRSSVSADPIGVVDVTRIPNYVSLLRIIDINQSIKI